MIFCSLCQKNVNEIENLWQNFSDKWSIDQMLSAFESGRFFVIGAYQNQKLIGVICASIAIDESDIELVYVDQDCRRQGVARSLVENAFTALKEKGVNGVFLEVRESNLPAIKLYESTGFLKLSVRKNYYQDGENAVVMKKELL